MDGTLSAWKDTRIISHLKRQIKTTIKKKNQHSDLPEHTYLNDVNNRNNDTDNKLTRPSTSKNVEQLDVS